MIERFGKENCLRVYLKCSIREQALRFLEREVSPKAFEKAKQLLPPGPFERMSQLAPALAELVGWLLSLFFFGISGFRSFVSFYFYLTSLSNHPPAQWHVFCFLSPHSTSCASLHGMQEIENVDAMIAEFLDNESRDDLDRERYDDLYGSHPRLDFRVSRLCPVPCADLCSHLLSPPHVFRIASLPLSLNVLACAPCEQKFKKKKQNEELYDLVVDTSENQSTDTYDQGV
jgi:hypothetical protein